MTLLMRPAAESDLPMLAEMNRQLILDEGSRNPMTTAQLEQRMWEWMKTDWEIQLFLEVASQQVLGYAVYQQRTDEYFPENKLVYLRQMFVMREMRRQGIGRLALQMLLDEEFPAGCRVEIDVLATNPQGFDFWQSMGFEADYTHMRLDR